MVSRSYQDYSSFETTKRLLAQLVNEELAIARISTVPKSGSTKDESYRLTLHGSQGTEASERWLKVNVRHDTLVNTKADRVIPILRPESLQPPVVLGNEISEKEELNPATIFHFISGWFTQVAETSLLETVADELRETAANQDKWLEISKTRPILTLDSPMIAWEQSLVFGHPTHLFHRLCRANPPLEPVFPKDIPGMLTPSIAFMSVPRTDMRVSGPYEMNIEPLLKNVGIPKQKDEGRMIIPCLSQQLPIIRQCFPNSTLIKEFRGIADAQASMRTISLRPEVGFGYQMKLSLACNITSAMRTVTPWTAGQGSEISKLLCQVLPAELWVFEEVASVTGGQDDFNVAKHFSCILRSDLELRAREKNETLIIATALIEPHFSDGRNYAERLFNLTNVEEKKAWLAKYLNCLFRLMLHPLVHHGIALEAHGQNVVARFCRKTGAIKGFAIRDFGGIKIHKPTLQSQGFDVSWEIPGSLTLSDDLTAVWNIISHSLLQSHVASMIYALRLETHGGWALAREELIKVLGKGELLDYFLGDTVALKCFLEMVIEGIYRHNLEKNVPNPLGQSVSRHL